MIKGKGVIIAIDGPAGSGKSTVAKALAEKLGFEYLDTGAMYRAVTWKALENKIDLSNEKRLEELAGDSSITFKRDEAGVRRVFIDGREVTEGIRTPAVNAAVSVVSRVEGVRRELVKKQQEIGVRGVDLVVEGRDAGTVIFPNAELKVYLTASVEERARRRYEELAAKGYDVTFEEIERDISFRDRIDSTRLASPLVQAVDALPIDTTDMTVEQVVEEIARLVEGVRRGGV